MSKTASPTTLNLILSNRLELAFCMTSNFVRAISHLGCFLLTGIFAFQPALPLAAQDSTATATATTQVPALVASDFVTLQVGDLPIILSAPHGGNLQAEGIPPRSGEGLAKGASGFFTGRDTGTEELAREVSSAIEKRFGKRPYLVASRLQRKYLDPNRPASIALDNAAVQPVYDLYHNSLTKYCREVTNRFHAGVLIDIHGQGTSSQTVYRGTKNGLTVTRLREKFGQEAHDGPRSLFGWLESSGWTVFPNMLRAADLPVDKEQSGFTGGYIVQTYGSHQAQPIDAMQLEFGMQYRTGEQRPRTAAILANALADYASAYLAIEVPPRPLEIPSATTAPDAAPAALMKATSPGKQLQVAVFVDAGVSSTAKLMELLQTDSKLMITKLSASDIQRGELDRFSVLVHPGGSGSGQGKALGEAGRAKVRSFIESGHGMVGICAGAYLASCDYDWSLHVLDAKVIDRQHWNRGGGTVAVALSKQGKDFLQLDKDKIDLYYHQGPLLAPAADPNVPDFVELARYEGEIAKNGAPTGVMPGTTAIAMGTFGKGRVVCYSPHPEKTPNHEPLILHGIHWAGNDEGGDGRRR